MKDPQLQPELDPAFPELSRRPAPSPRRRTPWLGVTLVVLLAAGGAVGWKMLGKGPAAAGGDPARDVMRAELMELSAAESAFVRANGRYAANLSELGTALTSRVAVFASAPDGYQVRLARPEETEQRCELSVGRFAAGHKGWQLLCGVPKANDSLDEQEPKPSLLERIRAKLHD
jgi:hypothetical protein